MSRRRWRLSAIFGEEEELRPGGVVGREICWWLAKIEDSLELWFGWVWAGGGWTGLDWGRMSI